jgi:hypothetical protein
MRWGVVLAFCLISVVSVAQESRFHAEFRREGERVADACDSFGLKIFTSCAYTLFTDHPLHIAAGSMPPQNGFGLGGAFVWEKSTTNWRMSWDFDVVGATSGAWRAGAYMKLVHTPTTTIHVSTPATAGSSGAKKGPKNTLAVHPYTAIHLYVQTISLNKLNFFGEGNDSTLAGASVFGMRETIIGGRVIKPVFEWPAIRKLNLSLLGELNGRFVTINPEHGQSAPSIEQLYTNATAPGLISQPGFIQGGEGIRIKPGVGYFHLNYLAKFEEYGAPSSSQNSFMRWTLDLDHTYDLHGTTKSSSADAGMTGPDECAPTGENCPRVPTSVNLNGSIGVRLLLSESITSKTSAVPFYFQPTLGGQDINSSLSLGSYRDYRFRAPNLLLLQESFEHSIWGPFGLKLMADEGRVALTHGDLGFSHLRHSFAGGLTLRAGGFPMISMVFAWGGPEGHHNVFNMNSSLLGGSARPPLD